MLQTKKSASNALKSPLRLTSNSLRHRPQNRSLFDWFKSKSDPSAKKQQKNTHVHGPHCNHGPGHDHGGHSHAPNPSKTSNSSQRPPTNRPPSIAKIEGIKHILAVSSGKGGVGKSTVAVNLALALNQSGKRVGLLDADIYGPSIPTMMNLANERPKVTEQNKIIPLVNYGIECMSMGFLVPQDAPTIWRGPMVMSALDQMLHQVQWGDLDVLVVDLPPGTGDAQLTLTQRTPLSGAVIVSTPQEVALADVRRGANMFRKVNVPILGVIENMSYFEPPCGCNKKYYIFGQGGAKLTAQQMDLDFLGEIPIDQNIRELCDSGRPSVAASPDSASSTIYREIAQKILDKLTQQEEKLKTPVIVFED